MQSERKETDVSIDERILSFIFTKKIERMQNKKKNVFMNKYHEV